MNALKKWSKKSRLSFIIFAVFLSLFLFLQGQICQSHAASARPAQKEIETYPATPEGVVEAYVRLYLVDAGDYPDQAVTRKYYPNADDIEANRKTRVIDLDKEWGEISDHTHIATGYEIKEVRKSDRKAEVKVLYKRLGWTWSTPIYISECRDSRTIKDMEKESDAGFHILETAQKLADKKKDKVWDAEKCKFLHITNDTQEEIYHLARPGEFWRIVSLDEKYVSINAKIKGLYRLEKSDHPRSTNPSEKQKEEIREAIRLLKKYLNNENKER